MNKITRKTKQFSRACTCCKQSINATIAWSNLHRDKHAKTIDIKPLEVQALKNPGCNAPKTLRLSSLLDTHEASLTSTGNHSHCKSSFYCLHRILCTVLQFCTGFTVRTYPTHSHTLDSHPHHIPTKVICTVKVSKFHIYDHTVLHHWKPLCWLVCQARSPPSRRGSKISHRSHQETPLVLHTSKLSSR